MTYRIKLRAGYWILVRVKYEPDVMQKLYLENLPEEYNYSLS